MVSEKKRVSKYLINEGQCLVQEQKGKQNENSAKSLVQKENYHSTFFLIYEYKVLHIIEVIHFCRQIAGKAHVKLPSLVSAPYYLANEFINVRTNQGDVFSKGRAHHCTIKLFL